MTDSKEPSEEITAPRQLTLLEFFRTSPLIESDLDFEREPEDGRKLTWTERQDEFIKCSI